MATLTELCAGLPLDPLPPLRPRDASLPHAPVRTPQLTGDENKVCLATARELENYVVLYTYYFLEAGIGNLLLHDTHFAVGLIVPIRS